MKIYEMYKVSVSSTCMISYDMISAMLSILVTFTQIQRIPTVTVQYLSRLWGHRILFKECSLEDWAGLPQTKFADMPTKIGWGKVVNWHSQEGTCFFVSPQGPDHSQLAGNKDIFYCKVIQEARSSVSPRTEYWRVVRVVQILSTSGLETPSSWLTIILTQNILCQ